AFVPSTTRRAGDAPRGGARRRGGGSPPPAPAALRTRWDAPPFLHRALPARGGRPRLPAGGPRAEEQGGAASRPRRQRAVTQPAATTSSSTSQLVARVWTTIAVLGTTRPPRAATRSSWIAATPAASRRSQ